MDENERCIDGARYRFVPNSASPGGVVPPAGEEASVAYYLSVIANLLQPISEHFASWQGIIISNDVTIPAGSQRKKVQIYPAARTIRIEADAAALIWLNNEQGMSISIGGDRRTLYLSDLPPKAAIHDIYVTTAPETRLSILAVA